MGGMTITVKNNENYNHQCTEVWNGIVLAKFNGYLSLHYEDMGLEYQLPHPTKMNRT